jgi:hypothetical protein
MKRGTRVKRKAKSKATRKIMGGTTIDENIKNIQTCLNDETQCSKLYVNLLQVRQRIMEYKQTNPNGDLPANLLNILHGITSLYSQESREYILASTINEQFFPKTPEPEYSMGMVTPSPPQSPISSVGSPAGKQEYGSLGFSSDSDSYGDDVVLYNDSDYDTVPDDERESEKTTQRFVLDYERESEKNKVLRSILSHFEKEHIELFRNLRIVFMDAFKDNNLRTITSDDFNTYILNHDSFKNMNKKMVDYLTLTLSRNGGYTYYDLGVYYYNIYGRLFEIKLEHNRSQVNRILKRLGRTYPHFNESNLFKKEKGLTRIQEDNLITVLKRALEFIRDYDLDTPPSSSVNLLDKITTYANSTRKGGRRRMRKQKRKTMRKKKRSKRS